MILFLFFVALAQATLTPHFSCWFYTYDGQRTYNYVLGYENTGTADILLPSNSPDNVVLPLLYNGQQPDIFKVGLFDFALVIRDTLHLGWLSWHLEDGNASVNATKLTPEWRCDTVFQGACPAIPHFCEDGSYCNGEETCSSSDRRVMGTCQNASTDRVVSCPPLSLCNEESLACVNYLSLVPSTPSPTSRPTPSPTSPPTSPPTQFMPIKPLFSCWYYETVEGQMRRAITFAYNNSGNTAIDLPVIQDLTNLVSRNVLQPYNGAQTTHFLSGFNDNAFTVVDVNAILNVPTGVINWYLTSGTAQVFAARDITETTYCADRSLDVETQPPLHCSLSNPNCSAFDTYCGGKATCNLATGQCVASSSYSPCPAANPDVPLSYVCVEHLTLCAQSIECVINMQCNDDNICNGLEWCQDGWCQTELNTSIEAICHTSQAICIEGEGCVFTGYPISNGAIAGIVIVGCVLLLGIIFLIVYFAYFRGQSTSKKNKNK